MPHLSVSGERKGKLSRMLPSLPTLPTWMGGSTPVAQPNPSAIRPNVTPQAPATAPASPSPAATTGPNQHMADVAWEAMQEHKRQKLIAAGPPKPDGLAPGHAMNERAKNAPVHDTLAKAGQRARMNMETMLEANSSSEAQAVHYGAKLAGGVNTDLMASTALVATATAGLAAERQDSGRQQAWKDNVKRVEDRHAESDKAMEAWRNVRGTREGAGATTEEARAALGSKFRTVAAHLRKNAAGVAIGAGETEEYDKKTTIGVGTMEHGYKPGDQVLKTDRTADSSESGFGRYLRSLNPHSGGYGTTTALTKEEKDKVQDLKSQITDVKETAANTPEAQAKETGSLWARMDTAARSLNPNSSFQRGTTKTLAPAEKQRHDQLSAANDQIKKDIDQRTLGSTSQQVKNVFASLKPGSSRAFGDRRNYDQDTLDKIDANKAASTAIHEQKKSDGRMFHTKDEKTRLTELRAERKTLKRSHMLPHEAAALESNRNEKREIASARAGVPTPKQEAKIADLRGQKKEVHAGAAAHQELVDKFDGYTVGKDGYVGGAHGMKPEDQEKTVSERLQQGLHSLGTGTRVAGQAISGDKKFAEDEYKKGHLTNAALYATANVGVLGGQVTAAAFGAGATGAAANAAITATSGVLRGVGAGAEAATDSANKSANEKDNQKALRDSEKRKEEVAHKVVPFTGSAEVPEAKSNFGIGAMLKAANAAVGDPILGDLAGQASGAIGGAMGKAAEHAQETLQPVAQATSEALKPASTAMSQAADSVNEHVGQPVRAAAHQGVMAVGEVGDQVSEGVQQAGHDVTSAADSAATTVKAAVGDPIHESLQSAASAVDEHVGQPIREAAEQAGHDVKSAADSASSVVHGGVEEAMHQAEPVATKVAEKIEAPDPFDTAVDAAGRGFGMAQEAVDDHVDERTKRLNRPEMNSDLQDQIRKGKKLKPVPKVPTPTPAPAPAPASAPGLERAAGYRERAPKKDGWWTRLKRWVGRKANQAGNAIGRAGSRVRGFFSRPR